MDNKLWYHINGGYLHNYLQTTHRWTTKVWDSIDMEALSQHLKKLTAPHQTTCSSQVHSQLSTLGVSNFRQAKVQDPNLKWCRKDADKTQPHLMGCKANLQQKDALAMLLKTIMSDDAHHIGTMLSICINKIRIISCCVVSINRKHPHPPYWEPFTGGQPSHHGSSNCVNIPLPPIDFQRRSAWNTAGNVNFLVSVRMFFAIDNNCWHSTDVPEST